jgi:hypothetical protein
VAEFFRTSTLWVVDYVFDGRVRSQYRALRADRDPTGLMTAELAALHGSRAQPLGGVNAG